jgi:hypothetical protein
MPLPATGANRQDAEVAKLAKQSLLGSPRATRSIPIKKLGALGGLGVLAVPPGRLRVKVGLPWTPPRSGDCSRR